MLHFMKSPIVTALASILLVGAVHAQAGDQTEPTGRAAPALSNPPSAPTTIATGMALASDIIGENVTTLADPSQDIAKVKDLVADADGQLLVVVDRDGGGLAGVPFDQFTPLLKHEKDDDAAAAEARTADVTALAFSGDMAKLAGAPPLDDIDHVDAAWIARSVAHFQGSTTTTTPAPDPPAVPDEGMAPADDIAVAAPIDAAPAKEPVCVDELVGKGVQSAAGKDIADVKDVAVDLGKGEVAYVVITSGGVLGVGDKLHGVKLEALTAAAAADGKLALNIDEAALERTPGLDLERLPRQPNLTVAASVSMRTHGDPEARR
jgi:sporulation protein YlmC with PRC-barrel domain